MVKRRKHTRVKAIGRFIEIKIMEQQNSREIIFRGKARLDDPEAVKDLFVAAASRGFELDYFF